MFCFVFESKTETKIRPKIQKKNKDDAEKTPSLIHSSQVQESLAFGAVCRMGCWDRETTSPQQIQGKKKGGYLFVADVRPWAPLSLLNLSRLPAAYLGSVQCKLA